MRKKISVKRRSAVSRHGKKRLWTSDACDFQILGDDAKWRCY